MSQKGTSWGEGTRLCVRVGRSFMLLISSLSLIYIDAFDTSVYFCFEAVTPMKSSPGISISSSCKVTLKLKGIFALTESENHRLNAVISPCVRTAGCVTAHLTQRLHTQTHNPLAQ